LHDFYELLIFPFTFSGHVDILT